MTAPRSHRDRTPPTVPQSRDHQPNLATLDHQPNLATLDRLRGLRRPRLMAPEARRHQVPQECSAC